MIRVRPLVIAAALPFVVACAPAVTNGGPAAKAADRGTPVTAGRAPAGAGTTPMTRRPRPKIPRGTTAGYVVFDRQSGRIALRHAEHRKFRSASVVKILIAIDLLESGKPVSAADRALLKSMLRASDDDAATTFWRRGGERRIVQRMAKRLGLKDTLPPPIYKPGFWGYSSLSASDIATTYRYLLDRADPKVSGLILGHLRKAAKCGKDGFDQSFGIPSAVPRPFAVKQGWSGFGTTPPVRCREDASGVRGAFAGTLSAAPAGRSASRLDQIVVPDLGRPVLHTTGLAGKGERLVMVLLTAHPAGTSWQESVRRTTDLTRQIHRAAS
nr:hypothetical protein [Spongiactinospora gelatinilytica]